MNINSSKIHYPKILYKYRDWDNELHKKVLLENKLYLASPKDFEDIFDCNLPEKFPRKDELYNFFIDKAKKIRLGQDKCVENLQEIGARNRL